MFCEKFTNYSTKLTFIIQLTSINIYYAVRAIKKPWKKLSKLRKEKSAQYRATLVAMAKLMCNINLRNEHIRNS